MENNISGMGGVPPTILPFSISVGKKSEKQEVEKFLHENYDIKQTNMSLQGFDLDQLLQKGNVLIFVEGHMEERHRFNFGQVANYIMSHSDEVLFLTENAPKDGVGQLKYTDSLVTQHAKRWDISTNIHQALNNQQRLVSSAEKILALREDLHNKKPDDLVDSINAILDSLEDLLKEIKDQDLDPQQHQLKQKLYQEINRVVGQIKEGRSNFSPSFFWKSFDIEGYSKFLVKTMIPLWSKMLNMNAIWIDNCRKNSFQARQESCAKHALEGAQQSLVILNCGIKHASLTTDHPHPESATYVIDELERNNTPYVLIFPKSSSEDLSERMSNLSSREVLSSYVTTQEKQHTITSEGETSNPQLKKEMEKTKSCREIWQQALKEQSVSTSMLSWLLAAYAEELKETYNHL
jgi:hypothetical protein